MYHCSTSGTTLYQGMYVCIKNRVENDRKFFEILLSCERGNSAEKGVGKIKKIYAILNFSALDFLVRKIKEQEFQKCSVILYPFFYTYPAL